MTWEILSIRNKRNLLWE